MSVEFSIYVRFQSIQDPVERFLEIVSQFQATGHYGQLHRLYVDDILYQHPPQPRKGKRHNPEYDRNRHTLLSRDTFKGDSLSVAQLPNLLASFRGEGMRVFAEWAVLNRYDKKGDLESKVIGLTTVDRTSKRIPPGHAAGDRSPA